MQAVKAMLDLSGRRSIHFKDNMPGKSWWYCFMSRHPDMKLKQTEKLEMARAIACSESKVGNWFWVFRDVPEEYGISSPTCIFNCAETGFPLQTKSGKVLTAKVDKVCYHLTSSSNTEITVLVCVCADGSVLPPYVLFPERSVRGALVIDLPPKSESYATESGWMNQNAFFTGWRKFSYPVFHLQLRGNTWFFC